MAHGAEEVAADGILIDRVLYPGGERGGAAAPHRRSSVPRIPLSSPRSKGTTGNAAMDRNMPGWSGAALILLRRSLTPLECITGAGYQLLDIHLYGFMM